MTRPVPLFVAAFLAVTGLTVGWCVLEYFDDPFDERPFTPEAWAAADPHDRGPMARDAIRHLPPGTPAARVRELLGKPEPVWRDPRGPIDGFGNPLKYPETWSYYLGCWSGMGRYSFDAANLYVHFDSDGLVVATEITGG